MTKNHFRTWMALEFIAALMQMHTEPFTTVGGWIVLFAIKAAVTFLITSAVAVIVTIGIYLGFSHQ